jgi:hypothetical protein
MIVNVNVIGWLKDHVGMGLGFWTYNNSQFLYTYTKQQYTTDFQSASDVFYRVLYCHFVVRHTAVMIHNDI